MGYNAIAFRKSLNLEKNGLIISSVIWFFIVIAYLLGSPSKIANFVLFYLPSSTALIILNITVAIAFFYGLIIRSVRSIKATYENELLKL